MADIPDILIWAVVIAVIIQGFSMALLVYLMYQRRKDEKRIRIEPAKPMKEEPPEEDRKETP